MDRLWSRVGARTLAVALLIGGIAGGVHLGQHRTQHQQDTQAQLALDVDAADLQMLKARQNEHAAARAQQREAESDAAAKAASEAKAAAGKASSLRQAVADKKKAEKAEKTAKANAKAAGSDSTGTVAYNGPIPSSCKEFVGNRATGCALMLQAGFGIDQFPCLNNIFNKESGWNAHAENKGSGAYGIPQALPGSKMSSVASDWRTNPATQIKWGIGYIKGKYDTPCKAWSHWQSANSY